MIRNHPAYEQGYSDGFNTGYNRALESQVDAAKRSSSPALTITAPAEVVNAARSDLARKVIGAVKDFDDWVHCTCSECKVDAHAHAVKLDASLDKLTAALRELFAKEGISVDHETTT